MLFLDEKKDESDVPFHVKEWITMSVPKKSKFLQTSQLPFASQGLLKLSWAQNLKIKKSKQTSSSRFESTLNARSKMLQEWGPVT